MPDEKPQSPFSLDNIHKIISVIALLGCVFMAWQRNTSNGDFTATQVTQLRSDLKDQSERLVQVQVKMAALEQQVSTLLATLQQDQRYRSATK